MNRNEIDIVEDAIQELNLPKLLRVPLFVCTDDCIEWLKKIQGSKFAIYDNPDFQLTTYRWGHQKIYQHKQSGGYWYFDYFHRLNGHPHYEVFDPIGHHLCEVDADTGKEIPNSQDNTKSITHIIHGNP